MTTFSEKFRANEIKLRAELMLAGAGVVCGQDGLLVAAIGVARKMEANGVSMVDQRRVARLIDDLESVR